MDEFEKLGVFYLGKITDPKKSSDERAYLLLNSNDLTTHAVCMGMTGSGKTGLCISLLEEAALDNIPSILIDPKGDLGNLMLTFPDLTPESFRPWIDSAEAERNGMSTDAFAASIADLWRNGLEKWGESAERIRKLKNAVEVAIYTPASNAGIPLSILSSFAAPPAEIRNDRGAMREGILTVASSLLGLVGINSDPVKSPEHILISSIIELAWKEGKDLDLSLLIQLVQKPPFTKIGALDLDTFIPPKERIALSVALNGLLASPGFQAWMEGEPLDIKNLLHTREGKPRIAIISIAHLNDTERMFFVTLFLNQLVAWMRKQPGTSSLRALFYMDEIFGYFPPTAMPPSKVPMLTLLKQARAFGLGIILSTQNPVDLDYKGLSNCGTWFIGKLQTERDKKRVIEGLQLASNGEIESNALDKLLAATGKRMFILRRIYQKEPVLFETRWTLSFLRGPLTLNQISSLSQVKEEKTETILTEKTTSLQKEKPAVPLDMEEYFLPGNESMVYQPMAAGFAKLHYINAKNNIDTWEEVVLTAPIKRKGVDWDAGEEIPDLKSHLAASPSAGCTFSEVPACKYKLLEKSLIQFLYQNHAFQLLKYPELMLTSTPGESEGDFRIRATHALRELRDKKIGELQEKYGKKIDGLNDRLRRCHEKAEEERGQASYQRMQTFINIGTNIIGVLFGRKLTKGTITQAGTSARGIERMRKQGQDVARAEECELEVREELAQVKEDLEHEIAAFPATDPRLMEFEKVLIKPRKTDIVIDKIALVWKPLLS